MATRCRTPGSRPPTARLAFWVCRCTAGLPAAVSVSWKVGCRARSAAHATWKPVPVTLETVTLPMGAGTGKWGQTSGLKSVQAPRRENGEASRPPALKSNAGLGHERPPGASSRGRPVTSPCRELCTWVQGPRTAPLPLPLPQTARDEGFPKRFQAALPAGGCPPSAPGQTFRGVRGRPLWATEPLLQGTRGLGSAGYVGLTV